MDAAIGDSTVLDELKETSLAPGNPELPQSETCHQLIFEGIDKAVIRNPASKLMGQQAQMLLVGGTYYVLPFYVVHLLLSPSGLLYPMLILLALGLLSYCS